VRRTGQAAAAVVAVWIVLMAGIEAQSAAADLYQEALARERVLRKELASLQPDDSPAAVVERIRVMAIAYEDISQLYPGSEQSDDALWQAGLLASDVFARFGDPVDRTMALRLLNSLVARFPSSPLARQAPDRVARLEKAAATVSRPSPDHPPVPPAAVPPPPAPPAAAPAVPAARSAGVGLLRAIRREVLPDVLRITLDLDREVPFTHERLTDPGRVFIDLQNTRTIESLGDTTIPVGDERVRQIRVGRQIDARTRIVFDVVGSSIYSVYALYNPYRIVIDFERRSSAAPARPRQAATPPAAGSVRSPAANAGGGFSLSRQLGLRVARIVIDPGHGGHDPGAEVGGLTEAGLVLDVALRLEALLKKEQDVDVVLTRRTSTYLSLEDRTAAANSADADLFLSIHANANSRGTVRGVETYFLNFAPNPEAEAIAARENADASRSMRELPDIVEAIALNNKRDESREFATIVQAALYERLRKVNRSLRNLGVKQAPFMVLVGATMPAILAEIAFMTNSQEAALLETERYRQQIAEALSMGVMRYQQALKKGSPVAAARP
jgi:N-acetylmuramoyl-L-alanine amidase